MSLSLKEKQFLRSVVELIVQNPEVAKDVLHFAKNQNEYSETLLKISPLIQYSESIDEHKIDTRDYVDHLIIEVKKISDREVRDVANSAIERYSFQQFTSNA